MVVSPSNRTNIPLFQKAFPSLKRKASQRNISFSVPKTELMHLRTPMGNQAPCRLPVHLEGPVFNPQSNLKWLGFLSIPLFNPGACFSGRLSLADVAFAISRRL